MDPSAGPGEGVFLADVEAGNVQVGSWALERRFDGGEMLRSARRPCKACDSTSSADSETGCILGSLIKELLVGSDCYLATDLFRYKVRSFWVKRSSLDCFADKRWKRGCA